MHSKNLCRVTLGFKEEGEANPYAMLGDLYEMHGLYEEAAGKTRPALQIVPNHLPPS
jgi:hypothetical protein